MYAWPDASTALQILEDIRSESRDEHEKGRWFENLFLRLICNIPDFEVAKAYRWSDWPDRERLVNSGPKDIGIDLVATLNDGSLVAIQCKCYDEKYKIQRDDINSFLAVSGPPFDMRWIVATCGWGGNAEKIIHQISEPTIRRIDFHLYDDVKISKGRIIIDKRQPLQKQSEAIECVVNGMNTASRGQLIMACGTGKTYTSLQIAESLVSDGGRILFLAPSIALISQTRREWLRYTSRPLEGMAVCSDRTSGGRGESEDMRISELECDVVNDSKKIGKRLAKDGDITRVVFSTYQSLKKVSDAQINYEAPPFDLIISDEAHRTTGVERNTGFHMVHDNTKISAKKRLYMTATQRIYTAKSVRAMDKRGYTVKDMEDFDTYGRVMFRLSFKEAVHENMLSDYRVIVMGQHEDKGIDDLYHRCEILLHSEDGKHEIVLNYEDVTRLVGTALAINGVTRKQGGQDTLGQLSKVIGFSNSRERSKAFTRVLNTSDLRETVAKRSGITRQKYHCVEHLDGTHSALERNRALRELGGANTDSPRMLTNVRLFTEGVDVPSLDAVVFLDPRNSSVDVVQAVGRVMRKAVGKRYGYIVIPVPLKPDQSLTDALETHSDAWKTTGQVLRALQSHDGRLPESPYQFIELHDSSQSPRGDNTQDGIQTIFDFEDISEKFYAHVVSTSGLAKPGQTVADEIRFVVDYAARMFRKAGIESILAGALGLSISSDGFTGANVSKIAALLITNACLLHRRLLGVIPGLDGLNAVAASDDPCGVLLNQWRTILKEDYRPVFEPALGVLNVLLGTDSRHVNQAIYKMADCANRIADSLSELGYDHSGPLYHDILGTAKSDSAYYTRDVSAVLLSRLALAEDFVDWTDSDIVSRLRIIDPACGTGTLLMAALQAIKWRIDYNSVEEECRGMIHRTLVENVLCGLDINRHAIQLAACNLTLGAPTIDYRNMNLYTMMHGPQEDVVVKAGSVELLRASNDNDVMKSLIQHMRNIPDAGGEHIEYSMTDFPIEGLDMVIMNPPFGSNESRGSKFSQHVVERMRQNESAIKKELTDRDSAAGKTVDKNSIMTFFIPLADRLLDKKRGTLAQVMPVTACTSVSGLLGRQLLADRFHVECVVITHDPKHINFSYNTSIHECLMVCRRHEGVKPPTKFVSLRRMPENVKEAAEAADAIAGGSPRNWGSMVSWPAERISAGDWTPVQWYDANLADIVYDLEQSPLLESVCIRHWVEPDGRLIRGSCERCNQNDDGAALIFSSINADLRKTIRGYPEAYYKPRHGKTKAAKKYLNTGSHLLIAARFSTTSSRLAAVYSDEPAVGSGWVPVSVSSKREAGALAVWWNSTPAIMMLLNRRSKKLTYPKWALNHLRETRIPKPDIYSGWAALYDTFMQVRDMEILPLYQAANDPVREMLDTAAAKVLDVNPDILANWRERLCREPTISNKRYPEYDAQRTL